LRSIDPHLIETNGKAGLVPAFLFLARGAGIARAMPQRQHGACFIEIAIIFRLAPRRLYG
jgi:hypothetical protein